MKKLRKASPRGKLSQQVTYWLVVVVIGLIVGLSLQFVQAWTEPAGLAPTGNVGAPINIGGNYQWKTGPLMLNTDGIWPNGLIVPNGNVSIGTATPGAYKLEIIGGTTKTTGGLIIETRTSDPASPEDGRIWLRTDIE